MKNLQKSIVLLMSLLVMASCTKKQELDITMNVVDYGDIEVKFLDDNGAGLSGVKVALQSGYSSPLDEGTTNEAGVIMFKQLLSGNYLVEAEEVEVNGKTYNVSQMVQVISGVNKSYEIIPSEFSATAEITIIDYFDGTPIADLNVGIFFNEDYSYNMTSEEVLEILVASGITNDEGMVVFEKLPLANYGVIVYTDIESAMIDGYAFQLYYKGRTEEITLGY